MKITCAWFNLHSLNLKRSKNVFNIWEMFFSCMKSILLCFHHRVFPTESHSCIRSVRLFLYFLLLNSFFRSSHLREVNASDLGSLLRLSRLTKVSISLAVMCFSSSLRLLCSRAVIVSSARISYPIWDCMMENFLAIYSCAE